MRAVRLDGGTQSQRRTPRGPRGQGTGYAVPAPAALRRVSHFEPASATAPEVVQSQRNASGLS